MAKTPMVQRTIRVPRELWESAQQRADEHDEHLSEVVRRMLVEYVTQTDEQDR